MMQEFITLSSKGQIVIPKQIREGAGLQAGDRLLLEWEGDRITLRKMTAYEAKPGASLVKEMLGKYKAIQETSDAEQSIRTLRENLYGKIDDRQ